MWGAAGPCNCSAQVLCSSQTAELTRAGVTPLMMSGGTMHCSHLLSPGLFREHLPCDWASTAGCEGSSTTSKLFCYIRREYPCYTCESVFVNSPGIISERQQRTLPNFRTWGKHSLPSDLKYFNSSYFLLSVKELLNYIVCTRNGEMFVSQS